GVEIAAFTLVKEGVREISPELSTQETEKIIPRNEGGIPWFAITTISESPVTPGIIWIGTAGGKVWLTKNYGKNWTEMTQKIAGVGGPEKYYVSRVFASNFKEGTAYISKSGYRRDDFRPFLFKTTDLGSTWTSSTSILEAGDKEFKRKAKITKKAGWPVGPAGSSYEY
ncbi:unnamed protein product, partial [marine sediment metagenome]